VRLVAWALFLVAVAIPVVAYLEAAAPPRAVSAQVVTPRTPASKLPLLRTGVKLGRGVAVVSYSGIRPEATRWAVTPAQLDAQLATLKASGFHTVTAAQFLAWLNGDARLPARPLLLTFNRGAKNIWRYADPIVARYGFHAVVFPVTGWISTHQPFYLNWEELRALRATRRWDIGASSNAAAAAAQINAAGRVRGAVTNLRWFRRERRRETLQQYAHRVSVDLDGSIAALQAQGLPRPQLFSFPNRISTARPNDARVPKLLAAIVHQRFRAAFERGAQPALVRRADAGHYLNRIQVSGVTSPRDLLQAVQAAARPRSGSGSSGTRPNERGGQA
jgi:hypothetical protein